MAKTARSEDVVAQYAQAARIMKMMPSNPRSSIRYNPINGKTWAEYKGLIVQDVVDHLAGKSSVGASPIMDDGTCSWAALDLDDHDSDDDVQLAPLDQKVQLAHLPLILCRSKSGSAHAYLFLARPLKAAWIRGVMARWATMIGWGGCEIFPKQAMLTPGKSGADRYGSAINFPYQNVANTKRFAFRAGKILTLDQFLETAEKLAATETDLKHLALADHPQAPPCVQRMMTEGVEAGQRNEGLYNAVVYFKKAFPDAIDEHAREFNNTAFAKPLAKAEASRTVASASRTDCFYRCHEEPIHSLCDKDACLKRKFGVSRDEYDAVAAAQSIPPFSNLVKYLSEPVKWEVDIDGKKVVGLLTRDLLEWRTMQRMIAERLMKVVPLIKDQEWHRILQPLMETARLIEAPDDASVAGLVRERLREFALRCDTTSRGETTDERKALLRGMPVVQVIDGERTIVFRGRDFVTYLKRARAEELKGIDLWFAVKNMGVGYIKMRVADTNINVWYIPISVILETEAAHIERPKFKAEL